MSLWKKRVNEWRRQEGDIAFRVDANEVQREWLNRPFLVGEGTVSLLFVEGRLEGSLVPGSYDVDGPLSRWAHGDQQITIVMVDSGGFPVRFEFEELETRENVPVSVRVEAVLRLGEGTDAASKFWREVMRDRTSYRTEDLRKHLGPIARPRLNAWSAERSIEEFGGATPLRDALEPMLRECLGGELERIGFTLVSAALLECKGGLGRIQAGHGDAHLAEQGEAVERRRLELLKKVRDRMLDDRLHELSVEQLMQEELHKIFTRDALRDHEKQVLTEKLSADLADLQAEKARERDDRARRFDRNAEAEDNEHRREQQRRDHDEDRARRIGEADTEAKIRGTQRKQEEEDVRSNQQLLKEALQIRQERDAARARNAAEQNRQAIEAEQSRAEIEAGKLAALDGVDLATKLAHLGDREALSEIARIEASKLLTPEQLLMLAAERSPAVAQALLERYRQDGRGFEEMKATLQQQVEVARQSGRSESDRLERIMDQLLAMVTRVDTERAKASSSTRVVPIPVQPPKPDGA